MKELRGKIAVVTGGASGIGLALVERFLAEGMKVVAADVEEPALAKEVSRLSAGGAELLGVRVDVRDAGQRPGTSVYTRDPDGNLIEFMTYPAAGRARPTTLAAFQTRPE